MVDFVQTPTLNSNVYRSMYLDQQPYDLFLLNDLIRTAAILCLCDKGRGYCPFYSPDSIMEQYVKLSRERNILRYFIDNFEEILLMYIYSRFGKSFNVNIERVKDTGVAFPIGSFVCQTELYVVYNPFELISYLEKIALSIFLYSGENGFVSKKINRRQAKCTEGPNTTVVDERFKKMLNVKPYQNYAYISSELIQDKDKKMNGISVINSLSTDENNSPFMNMYCQRPTVLLQSTTSYAQTQEYNAQPPIIPGPLACESEVESYINSQCIMIGFNSFFSEKHRITLLYLDCIRTLLYTGLASINTLFILENHRAEQANKEKKIGKPSLVTPKKLPDPLKTRAGIGTNTNRAPTTTYKINDCQNRPQLLDNFFQQQKLQIDVTISSEYK